MKKVEHENRQNNPKVAGRYQDKLYARVGTFREIRKIKDVEEVRKAGIKRWNILGNTYFSLSKLLLFS